MWGGDIKIGARSYWALAVFVLVLSNINIVWQKLLSAPLSGGLDQVFCCTTEIFSTKTLQLHMQNKQMYLSQTQEKSHQLLSCAHE